MTRFGVVPHQEPQTSAQDHAAGQRGGDRPSISPPIESGAHCFESRHSGFGERDGHQRPVAGQPDRQECRAGAVGPASAPPVREDAIGEGQQRQPPADSRHPERLEESQAEVAEDLDAEPGEPEPGQVDRQQDRQPGPSRRPGRAPLDLLEPPERQEGQDGVAPPGEPLRPPPEVRQHVLRPLQLDAQEPELIVGQPAPELAPLAQDQGQRRPERRRQGAEPDQRGPPGHARCTRPGRPGQPADPQEQRQLQADGRMDQRRQAERRRRPGPAPGLLDDQGQREPAER
ncbi:MAG TPA: hypothetical protein VKP69_12300 [Isosphaeraceae bacterium]|nr:hypothetical protein [Isosphaeraceae bacterium]